MRRVRIGDQLNYQISEALTYCFLGRGKNAKAYQEAGVLRKGIRRVTTAEAAYLAVQDALLAAQQQLRSRERMDKELPGWDWHLRLPRRPDTCLNLSGHRFRSLASARGRLETIGKSEDRPAVVAAMKKVDKGVLLTFKKISWKYPRFKYKCTQTNKVDYYEIRGNRLQPKYRSSCRTVGKPKWITVKYQEKPLVIPAEDAPLVKSGRFVEIIVNSGREGDTAVANVFLLKGKRAKGKQTVIEGVSVQ